MLHLDLCALPSSFKAQIVILLFCTHFLKSISLGSIGDCFSELNQPNEAFEYYQKAFNYGENSYTSPKFLFKAALLGSQIGKNRLAIKFLKKIKDEFPDSYEAALVEVQLGRLENIVN